jgi:hypothetical protein
VSKVNNVCNGVFKELTELSVASVVFPNSNLQDVPATVAIANDRTVLFRFEVHLLDRLHAEIANHLGGGGIPGADGKQKGRCRG